MLWCVPALTIRCVYYPAFLWVVAAICAEHSWREFYFYFFRSQSFSGHKPLGRERYYEKSWSWIPETQIAFVLDPLSLLMILVITLVASLVRALFD